MTWPTSTFSFKSAEEGAARFSGSDSGYKYTRLGNPTVDALEQAVNQLEGGHGDVVAGMIVSRSREIHERLAATLANLGGTMDPHQAWLVLRGLRTLAMRIEKTQENAQRLAVWLESNPRVAWVSYPGLASHRQRDLMLQQMAGPGAMIAFGVRGGLDAARTMIDALRLCARAVSLGGVETLIEHPASMTHAGMSSTDRAAAGIRDDLVRLAVGCEAFEDLRTDLEQALTAAVPLAVGASDGRA